MGVIKNYIE